jgi:hypothetical protein
MALMLRYLGIPARVAVGFAGGTYDPNEHIWNVTDREAHAWVEVWFKGYGWLPFDPTPAGPGAPPRATQAGTTAAGQEGSRGLTPSAAAQATSTNDGASTVERKLKLTNGIGLHRRHKSRLGAVSPAAGSGGSDRGLPILILLLVVVGAGAAVVLAKTGSRAIRGARRDPRRIAAACREELAAFLVDQRIEVPQSATLGELGDLVRHEFGVRPEPFVAAATAARFGRTEDAAAAARTARSELRDLLDAARRGLTRRERLRGLLSLRSLARPARPVDASGSLGSGIAGSTGS